MSDLEFLTDWLGEQFRVGDTVAFTSSSWATGMNLGTVERIDEVERKVYVGGGQYAFQAEKRVKIRPVASSHKKLYTDWAVTYLERNPGFQSITKWPTDS